MRLEFEVVSKWIQSIRDMYYFVSLVCRFPPVLQREPVKLFTIVSYTSGIFLCSNMLHSPILLPSSVPFLVLQLVCVDEGTRLGNSTPNEAWLGPCKLSSWQSGDIHTLSVLISSALWKFYSKPLDMLDPIQFAVNFHSKIFVRIYTQSRGILFK